MQRLWSLLTHEGLGAIPILKLRQSLLQDAQLSQQYLVLTASSCLISTLGLLINSTAVVIGAMIIAPLMLPLRSFAFATLEGDRLLLRASFGAIAVGTALSIACSWLVGLLVGLPEFGTEVLLRTQPTLIDLSIAIVAGGVSGYAKIRPAIGDAIPGTAIAIALMPPLCAIGLLLSQGDWTAAGGASLLYITNLLGINLACLTLYAVSGYARSDELSRSLSWAVSIVLILLLALPLGLSSWRLVSRVRANESVEVLLREQVLNRDSEAEILTSTVNWRTDPPAILLTIRAAEAITPREVALLEQALAREMQRSFKIVIEVTPSRLVESDTPAAVEDAHPDSDAERR
ncbi:MAG: DUF389 domain-containing protein [Spirulinaceae cyanobacterium SM2_1_0]|nr:DUF389 domain-containing protein [Spirulinaceae cyanobacterium SM2_1_0]